MRKRTYRAIAAVFLAAALVLLPCFGCISLSVAYADSAFGGGDGTVESPYIIATADHLNALRGFCHFQYRYCYFLQTQDIALGAGTSYPEWAPLGDYGFDNSFYGTYDGGGHRITGLTIADSDNVNVGLFGSIEDGTVRNLRMENVNITCTLVTETNNGTTVAVSGACLGAICGSNGGTVANCTLVSGSISGTQRIGGIAGISGGYATVTGCTALSGVTVQAENSAGGIVGENFSGTISQCGNFASVSATGAGAKAGGISSTSSFLIDCCFNRGGITSAGTAGGLVASNSQIVKESYSAGSVLGLTAGGLIGQNTGEQVYSCYYDSELCGLDDTGKGVPLATAQMKSKAAYSWDFGYIWGMRSDRNDGYPYLLKLVPWADFTAVPGAGDFCTALTPLRLPATGNRWVVRVSGSYVDRPETGDEAPSGSTVIDPYEPGSDVPGVDPVTNKYVCLYEAGTDGITAFAELELTAEHIRIPVTPAPSAVTVVNNGGKADTILVENLAEAAKVTVYSAAVGDDTLASATVTAGGTSAMLAVAQLGEAGGSVYVSAKGPGKVESARVQCAFAPEPGVQSLEVTGGRIEPAYSPGTGEYSIYIPYTSQAVSFVPRFDANTLSVNIDGVNVASGSTSPAISVAPGSQRTVTAVASGANGATRVYRLTLACAVPSANNRLAALALANGTLSPALQPDVTGYKVSLPYAAAGVQLLPAAESAAATVKVNGVAVPGGAWSKAIAVGVGKTVKVSVQVIAENDATRMYTLTVTRAKPSSNNYLKALKLSAGSVAFKQSKRSYSVTVAKSVAVIRVQPQSAFSGSKIKVNGVAVASGAFSGDIKLKPGKTTVIRVRVTAETRAVREYVIRVYRKR